MQEENIDVAKVRPLK